MYIDETCTVEDQGFKPRSPFCPPCRGVAPGLGHAGDSVHSIVIYLTYIIYFEIYLSYNCNVGQKHLNQVLTESGPNDSNGH